MARKAKKPPKKAPVRARKAAPPPANPQATPKKAGQKSGPATGSGQWGFTASRQFVSWLAEHNLSLAATTYQAGKLLLVGRNPEGQLSIMQRNFPRCMGMWTNGQTMLVSSLYQILRFENTVRPGARQDSFDRMFVPKMAYITGDLDVHDICMARDGRIVFVNTLFGCLATVSPRWSFEPLWRPAFLSKLAAEDRCHLNGMAVEAGRPRYVTAISEADVNDGWRDHRNDGGVVIDIASNENIATGLSMPHSPRVHRGRVWLLDSGTGYFGYVEPDSGTFTPLTFCPGYARGLAFHGDFAVVGLSRPRERSFSGLALQDALEAKKANARSGLIVIDLRSGDIVHSLYFEGDVSELYDVAVLPGITRPGAIGFASDEIRRAITIAPPRPARETDQADQAGDPTSDWSQRAASVEL